MRVPVVLSFDSELRANLRLDRNFLFYEGVGGGFRLFERYAIKAGPPIGQTVGTWSRMKGLNVSQTDIVIRRSGQHLNLNHLPHHSQNLLLDFRGAVLKNGLLPYAVITQFVYDDKGKFITARGLFVDIIKDLEVGLNFRTETVISRDGKWGGWEGANGTFNGLVGMLADKEVDLVTAGLTVTYQRSKAIDYRQVKILRRSS